jgi:hypothetical protein
VRWNFSKKYWVKPSNRPKRNPERISQPWYSLRKADCQNWLLAGDLFCLRKSGGKGEKIATQFRLELLVGR